MTRPRKLRSGHAGDEHTTNAPEAHRMDPPPIKAITSMPPLGPPARLEPAPAGGLTPRPTERPAPQTVAKVRCAYCRSEHVEQRGIQNGMRYYRCLRCCDLEDGAASTFKVAIVDPLGMPPMY